MKSEGESVYREVGQAKFCATTRQREELKEVKSDFMARLLVGGFKVGEQLLGSVCLWGMSWGVSGKGRTLLCYSFPICMSCRRTDGEASSVWEATSTHPSWGLNPGLWMLVVLHAEFPRLYNTEGLVDVDGSKWVTVYEQAVQSLFFIINSSIPFGGKIFIGYFAS